MAVSAERNAAVGVDIAPDYIRAVEIERLGQEYHLRGIGMKRTPEGALKDGVITDPRAMAQALRELFHDRGFETHHAITAIRGAGVVTRLLHLPAMPHDRIRNIIETEVRRYVRFAEEDKVVYYHPMEEYEEGGRRKISVLLVVARKDLCNGYYDTFRKAGLELDAIDVGFFSSLRVLRNNMTGFPPGSFLSVVFDYDGVAVSIMHSDRIRFFRNIKIDRYDVKSFTNGFMDRVMSELMLSVHFYEEESPRREEIRKMVLSMGVCGDTDVPRRIADSFADIPVEMHAPFTNIRVDPKTLPPNIMEKVDMSFLTPVGLALRGREAQPLPFEIDLLPAEIGVMKTIGHAAKIFLFGALLVAAVFAAYVGWMRHNLALEDAKIKAITAKIQGYDRVIAANGGVSTTSVDEKALNADTQVTADWAGVLEETKTLVPKETQLINLTIDEKTSAAEFTGFSEKSDAIYYFLSSLGKSSRFSGPQLVTRENATMNGYAGVRFVIRCAVNR